MSGRTSLFSDGVWSSGPDLSFDGVLVTIEGHCVVAIDKYTGKKILKNLELEFEMPVKYYPLMMSQKEAPRKHPGSTHGCTS